MKKIVFSIGLPILLFALIHCNNNENNKANLPADVVVNDSIDEEEIWKVPDTSEIPHNEFGDMVRYGRDLILNTAYYIGPEGKVGKFLGNKMNCTNCHLDAGTRPYAFNYFSTHARYPQYRARENKILSLADRVNNCIERPHNGKHLPLNSKEMLAIISYMKWLGENVPVNGHVKGDGHVEFEYPERAADPVKGELVYKRDCESCHGKNGEGKMRLDNVCYEYPPLWGNDSYQAGSSVHRVTKLGAFIYANMPNKIATYDNPKLTIEEAFDVCAFINNDDIHKRPQPVTKQDYPNVNNKPIDYAGGPYIDSFPMLQHKYGPYKPIIEYYKKIGKEPKF
ncbi:MAG: cytochrome class [Bacteroidetes bacterium]|jgi:thiosulfate dehydrogenase|nr:cytochrome class [Bacteroidota bacterium]